MCCPLRLNQDGPNWCSSPDLPWWTLIVDTEGSHIGVRAIIESILWPATLVLWTGLLCHSTGVTGCGPGCTALPTIYLHGSHLLLHTDYASLTWLLNFKQSEGQTAWWVEVLQVHDFYHYHWPGRQHGYADTAGVRWTGARCHQRLQPSRPGNEVEPRSGCHCPQKSWSNSRGLTPLHLVRRWLERVRCVSTGTWRISNHYQWVNFELHNGLLYTHFIWIYKQHWNMYSSYLCTVYAIILFLCSSIQNVLIIYTDSVSLYVLARMKQYE